MRTATFLFGRLWPSRDQLRAEAPLTGAGQDDDDQGARTRERRTTHHERCAPSHQYLPQGTDHLVRAIHGLTYAEITEELHAGGATEPLGEACQAVAILALTSSFGRFEQGQAPAPGAEGRFARGSRAGHTRGLRAGRRHRRPWRRPLNSPSPHSNLVPSSHRQFTPAHAFSSGCSTRPDGPFDPAPLFGRGTVGPVRRADRPRRRTESTSHPDQQSIRRYPVSYCDQHPCGCRHRRPPSRVLRTVRAGHRPAARHLCPDSRAAGRTAHMATRRRTR